MIISFFLKVVNPFGAEYLVKLKDAVEISAGSGYSQSG